MTPCADWCRGPSRLRGGPLGLLAAVAFCLVAPLLASADAVPADSETVQVDPGAPAVDSEAGLEKLDAELSITGLTFVGSRGNVSEFVLRARQAHFEPGSRVAVLQDVRVTASDEGKGRNFEVRCERGEFDVDTSDFLAEGNVEGSAGDGRRYEAPWVRYDHERALLYTDAAVILEDETGTFRGHGFRYHVKERRFRLLGNVSVVQMP
jgi:LPS export ABC transporter protein LptC